jgi:hypothetical protein
MRYLTRLLIAVLWACGLFVAIGPGLARAEDDPENPDRVCRRLYGTSEWTRRCRPQQPGEDFAAFCRRVYGTDEWTRRCLPQRPGESFRAYCRRIYDTDAWTRRCLPQRPDESLTAYCRRRQRAAHELFMTSGT